MRTVYTPEYKAFLKKLLAAREAAGLTQQQVAAALKIPQSQVSRAESGERRVDVIELKRYAVLYGKSVGYFLR
jgi:transcriptional regulator with XRE-family HTH domain